MGGSVSPAAPFPLTPALSPKERVPRRPRYELAGAPDLRESGLASPSPQGSGCSVGRRARCLGASICRHAADSSRSPQGEGRGEGERGSRLFHSARSSEPDTLQTRFQFLAAMNILVRSRSLRLPPAWPGCAPGGLPGVDLPDQRAEVQAQMLHQQQLAVIFEATFVRLNTPARSALELAALLPPDRVPWPWSDLRSGGSRSLRLRGPGTGETPGQRPGQPSDRRSDPPLDRSNYPLPVPSGTR